MKEIADIDAILGQLENPNVGKNALDIMDMLKEVNKILGEFQKTSRMLDSMGLKPLLVRAAGHKLGVDAETPLACETGLQPASEQHKHIFERLNQLPVEEIAIIPEAINKINAAKNTEEKNEKEVENDE